MHSEVFNSIEFFGEDITKRMLISKTIKLTLITEKFSEKIREETSPFITVSQFCEQIIQLVEGQGFKTSKEEVMHIWLTTIVCELM